MDFRTIRYEQLGAVVRITANRPEVLNAQSRVMIVELDEAFRAATDHAATRAIIVAGAGNHFSAGHAEIIALRHAGARARNYRLTGATLYVTVEPCAMCCGAAIHARLARLVYGAADPKGGAARSLYRLLEDPRLNHSVAVAGPLRGEESAALLREFFESKRA